MEELSKSQKGRTAIAAFKTLADALILRGSYQPSGKTGQKLEDALRQFSPEIYGSMSDPRIVELKGLEYVIDRLPRGVEGCNKIVLTAQEDLEGTSFEEVLPLKRRRLSYIVSDREMCFVVTRGATEIYDIITHLTFLNIEAQKIHKQICLRAQETCMEWQELQHCLARENLTGTELDQAVWNISIILGRTYKETRETYEYLETTREQGFNSGLFQIVYSLGNRVINEEQGRAEPLAIYFTPSLQEILGHHRYASALARSVKRRLVELGLQKRPINIVSANLHSFRNVLFGQGAIAGSGASPRADLPDMIHQIIDGELDVDAYAAQHGFFSHEDHSGSNIDVQIIDSARLDPDHVHPSVKIDWEYTRAHQPVLLIMNYAFGIQAYELLDELLGPCSIEGKELTFTVESISVMGKAGILPGKKGDIMLATAHVMEGTPHNYIVSNDLSPEDFADSGVSVFSGPMVTVLGTSLQNRAVLERFHSSSWRAIGLEMEGGHYQRAISAAIIQGHIPQEMKLRYAYYASDNPLISGETLASGPMGSEGIFPTYLITRVIIEKIMRPDHDSN
jgi:hypothetical protein